MLAAKVIKGYFRNSQRETASVVVSETDEWGHSETTLTKPRKSPVVFSHQEENDLSHFVVGTDMDRQMAYGLCVLLAVGTAVSFVSIETLPLLTKILAVATAATAVLHDVALATCNIVDKAVHNRKTYRPTVYPVGLKNLSPTSLG